MGYDYNIYYDKEKFGLEIVNEVDSAGDYSFDKTVIFKDKDNNFYFASDSGCSCPSPFEDFTSVADLTKLTLHEFHALEQEMQRHLTDPKYLYRGISQVEINEFLKKVKEVMKGCS